MTLFTLSNDRKSFIRSVFIYIGVVIFCVAFGIIYEIFSHGIVSNFMLFGFLVPLILGLLPRIILLLKKSADFPSVFSDCFYNAGVATLTAGSYFKGVLDIYGTTRDVYLIVYLVLGIILLHIGIISYAVSIRMKSE